MTARGYKKYMKKDVRQGHPLVKIFIISFFGMLLLSTFIINSVAKKMTVDTSIGDYKEQYNDSLEDKKIVDNRLAIIQNEDQSRSFTDIMQNAEDNTQRPSQPENYLQTANIASETTDADYSAPKDIVYKVYIGSYTSAEQAKAAKEIIQESGTGFSPIVKCLGANNYTLQVGIFKNKQSAETMLLTIKNSNLPGRIVQDN